MDNDNAVAHLVVRPSLQMLLFASGQESSHITILVDVPGIQGGCLPEGRAVDGEEEAEGLASLARRDDCKRWGTGDERDPVAGFTELIFSSPYLIIMKNRSA
jgi:hypothetical protein